MKKPELKLSLELAAEIGLNESIMLSLIHYWTEKTSNLEDGEYWICNSVREWHEQLAFWSDKTVWRVLSDLERQGYIISGNYNETKMIHNKWYRANYDMFSIEDLKRFGIEPKMHHSTKEL